MAPLMRVTVERPGGKSASYPILPKTIVAFERHFGVGLAAISSDARMEYVYWLAWDAEKTSGTIVKPFEEWLDEVESVASVGEAPPLDEKASPVS
jgi:hypothetical protein